jgi:hypothetical protein
VADFALVARLFNQKKVLVEPNYDKGVCQFRYLTDKEMADDTLYTDKKYIWQETPLLNTVEDNLRLIFVNIDSTPIVLNRLPVQPTRFIV